MAKAISGGTMSSVGIYISNQTSERICYAGRRMVRLFSLLLLLVASNACLAEPPQKKGRDGDAFFSAMREVYTRYGADRELVMLLGHSSVRKEVDLDDASYEQLKDRSRNIIEKMMAVRKELRGKPSDEIRGEVLRIAKEHSEGLRSLIAKVVGKQERMLGLYVQAVGPRAAVNDLVAERLGIGHEELEKLREVKDELWRQTMRERYKEIGRLIREGDRAKIEDHIAASKREFESQMNGQLTSEQRSKLEALKGEPFDLPNISINMQRRGGGGRGPRSDGKPSRRHDEGRPPKPCL